MTPTELPMGALEFGYVTFSSTAPLGMALGVALAESAGFVPWLSQAVKEGMLKGGSICLKSLPRVWPSESRTPRVSVTIFI